MIPHWNLFIKVKKQIFFAENNGIQLKILQPIQIKMEYFYIN